MPEWLRPEGVTGPISTIAVTAAAPRSREYKCPMAEALKARPSLRVRSVFRPREKLETFAFGPFMTALDQIELGTRSVEDALSAVEGDRRIHDGLKVWTARAVQNYLRDFPAGSTPMVLVRQRWTYERQVGQVCYRISAWGRCYQSATGRSRELRLVTMGSRSAPRSDAEVAIAAYVVAHAGDLDYPPVEHLRVLNYAIDDGSTAVLFDGTPDEATAAYEKDGRSVLGDVAGGQEYRPGAACVKCDFITKCPAVVRAPGLLGVDGDGLPRRQWSVTSARSYRECPARAHLRELRLPTDGLIERSGPAQRGRALHALLAERHRTGQICSAQPDEWTGEGFGLSPEDIALGQQLLRHHAEVCPIRVADSSVSPRIEPRLTWEDRQANAVVIAEPDLLYQDHDSWVWRETKTSSSDRRRRGDLLTEYPQIALGVLVLARGELGGQSARSRVELEVLRPSGVDLYVLDPLTPSVRRSAEVVIRDLAVRWRADEGFAPQPGQQCTRCEVAKWCRARR